MKYVTIFRFCVQWKTQKTLCFGFSQQLQQSWKQSVDTVCHSTTVCMEGPATSLQNGGPMTRPSKPSEFFVTTAIVMPNGTQCQWGKICSSPRRRKQHIHTCFVSESWQFFWTMRYSMAHKTLWLCKHNCHCRARHRTVGCWTCSPKGRSWNH